MKYLLKSLALALFTIVLLVFASCGNDDSLLTIEEEVIEQATEDQEKEESPIVEPEEEVSAAEEHGTETSDKIACNVLIKGGVRIEGLPPASNSSITMDLMNAGLDAYLNEGFDIPIISDADVIGAYIQFRVEGEGISTSYHDVNLQENNAFTAKTTNRAINQAIKGSSLSGKPVNSTLDVDFSPEIVPGEFCYLISVYDANGNISAPQEVCITVNGWGGNDALIGEWHFTKSENYFFDSEAEIHPVNVERCSTQSFVCTNGSSLEYEDCFTKQYETFTFNSDGTYTHTYGQIGRAIDALAADTNCEVVLQDTAFSFVINGNWSFDPDNEQLIIVEYELINEGTSGSYTEIVEPGQGYVYNLQNTSVENDVFSWGYPLGTDLNGDGQVNAEDEGYASFYEKQ